MSAVGSERKSTVVGYIFIEGNFQETSDNLPMRVAVLCEANTANQGTLDLSEWQYTTLKETGLRYGFGSPAYLIARIMAPILGGIPLVFYPQAAAIDAISKKISITVSGSATENATHTLVIAGRDGMDGTFYNIGIQTGDSAADIHDKITAAVTLVLGTPVSSTNDDYSAVLESKWKGLTANEINVTVDDGGKPAGITYTIDNDMQAAAGAPSIAAALALFGNKWNTMVVNSYGTVTQVMTTLEQFNGVPDPLTPTGRYAGIIMKPFIAFTGSNDEDPSTITDARKDEVTISVSPSPLSPGLSFESAANKCAKHARISQDDPALDPINTSDADMPTPLSIGAMADYSERDRMLKEGCSTVTLVSGKYQMEDSVTTYHPEGELNPVFAYTSDLVVMWNIRYGYYLLEQQYLIGKKIVRDQDNVTSGNIIKPKMWAAVVLDYFKDLVSRGLIADYDFSKTSLVVNISSTNPNRFDTSFRTKIRGIARISSTENTVGFNFG